jgi:hypothetical protein
LRSLPFRAARARHLSVAARVCRPPRVAAAVRDATICSLSVHARNAPHTEAGVLRIHAVFPRWHIVLTYLRRIHARHYSVFTPYFPRIHTVLNSYLRRIYARVPPYSRHICPERASPRAASCPLLRCVRHHVPALRAAQTAAPPASDLVRVPAGKPLRVRPSTCTRQRVRPMTTPRAVARARTTCRTTGGGTPTRRSPGGACKHRDLCG